MAKEKRLIDANELMQSRPEYRNTNDVLNSDFNCGWNACNREYWNLIAGSPTVDAVEVVHGRWEKAEYHGFLRCSECKDVYIDDTWVADGKWNYCPNCGAKMDGDGND